MGVIVECIEIKAHAADYKVQDQNHSLVLQSVEVVLKLRPFPRVHGREVGPGIDL